MRIAVIGARLTGLGDGDPVPKVLAELCPRLARRGHVVDLFSPRGEHGLAAMEGVRSLHPPAVASHILLSSLWTAWRGYDVVNFFAAEAASLFSPAAKLGLCRTVVSVLALDRPPSPLVRLADAVTVSTRRLERLFRDKLGCPALFIPPGMDRPGPVDAAPLRALGLAPLSYVLLADALEPCSGIHVALSAFRALDTPFRLVVAETGPGDDTYRRQLTEGASANELFTGPVPDETLEALMAHAYLYVLPAEGREAPPALLSALAHGRAVVVGDSKDHMDVIGADGFTFTGGDSGDLRRVLAWLLDDAEIVARMGVRAAANLAARQCWDRVADTYERVYAAITQGAA